MRRNMQSEPENEHAHTDNTCPHSHLERAAGVELLRAAHLEVGRLSQILVVVERVGGGVQAHPEAEGESRKRAVREPLESRSKAHPEARREPLESR